MRSFFVVVVVVWMYGVEPDCTGARIVERELLQEKLVQSIDLSNNNII
jgi:hypothetical protein